MAMNQANEFAANCENRQVIGMAYVPVQQWQQIYKCDSGFYRGTIFAELDKPWHGVGGGRCE